METFAAPQARLEWDRFIGPKSAPATAPYVKSNDRDALLALAERLSRPSRRVFAMSLHSNAEGEYRTYLLEQPARLTGDAVAEAHVAFRKGYENPNVTVSFTKDGAQSLVALTNNNLYRRLAIVLDGRVLAAPVMTSRIRGAVW
jgi:preprotein translocase subunit SecD